MSTETLVCTVVCSFAAFGVGVWLGGCLGFLNRVRREPPPPPVEVPIPQRTARVQRTMLD